MRNMYQQLMVSALKAVILMDDFNIDTNFAIICGSVTMPLM
jgi:hypothetical protein